MSDDKLILHPGSGLALAGPLGARIVGEMVSGALALARVADTGAALVPRFSIGEHVFCEPDYQQILLWAKALELEPVTVLERLMPTPRSETQLVNGRIIALSWNFDLLPLESFEWVEGLVIESIAFFVHKGRDLTIGALSLPLPELRRLGCEHMGLNSIDLSATPQLTWLSCKNNELTELDLSAVTQLKHLACFGNGITELDLSSVPQLTELWCCINQITELDLSGVPLLTRLDCCQYTPMTKLDIRPLEHLKFLGWFDKNIIHLIQRPDQNF